jgi:muconate cycloisomerase
VIVRIATADGVLGYGEACPVQAFTSETQTSIVELVETRVAPTLIGRDASQRIPLLTDLARVLRFAPFTVAAVDTALLDLLGRQTGVPVSTLLGGAFRDRVEGARLGHLGRGSRARRRERARAARDVPVAEALRRTW